MDDMRYDVMVEFGYKTVTNFQQSFQHTVERL